MSSQRILGFALLIVGVFLFAIGLNASNSVARSSDKYFSWTIFRFYHVVLDRRLRRWSFRFFAHPFRI